MATDETDNSILEHLHAIRASLARYDERFDEIIQRLSSVERDLAGMRVDFIAMQVRLDRHGQRLTRIEKRLELA